MNAHDFLALSPLLILVAMILLMILVESFAEKASRRYAFALACCGLTAALAAALFAPGSDNPLLTAWVKFDALSRFFNVFFLSIGLASAFLAASFFQRFDVSRGEYYFLLLAAVAGLLLIGSAASFLTLFIGLETLSIALYVLCGYMKKWELSHEAALKYFFMGSLAAAFLLYGVALIYGALGTTRFDALLSSYQALVNAPDHTLFMAGIMLVTLGLAFKAAIVPFHVWAPDVYDGAPNPVTALMSVGTKAGAFAAFIRVFMEALPHFNPVWNQSMALLAYPTLVYANLVALRQTHLRRFFAYSGISHSGFLLLPLAAGYSPESLQSMLFYLIVYAFATLGSFAVLALLDHKKEGVLLQDLAGLFHRRPLLAALLSLCLLTLAGIPPTAGFFAKFYLFKVAFEAGYYGLVITGLLTSILAAFYYCRIISVMLTATRQESRANYRSWPAMALAVLVFVAILGLSFFPAPLMALFAQ